MGTTALTPRIHDRPRRRLDDLRDLAVFWMRRYPLAPLESERVPDAAGGIAQWLTGVLAEDPRGRTAAAVAASPPAPEDAVAGAVPLQPGYRAVLGRLFPRFRTGSRRR
ncbi:hypothetical protein ACPA9J_28090 [Pseudomonas aeruginosa]